MKVIYSGLQAGHNPATELYDGILEPYAEQAARTQSILSALKADDSFDIIEPNDFPDTAITAVHTPEYVDYIKSQSINQNGEQILRPSNFIMDTYTPIVSSTYVSAKTSAFTALTGAQMLLDGEKQVYSLCRPPGHHADCNHSGGYCYFNNTAIAASYLSNHSKVAILDIDYHHGNGTQNIFYDRSDVLYCSLHADPLVAFPYGSGFEREKGRGSGIGYNKNYPLPIDCNEEHYRTTLSSAITAIKEFNANFLIISAGFDTHKDDPIAGLDLSLPFYKMIATDISSIKLPTLIIQEGGYNLETLGDICYLFLSSLND